MSKTPSPAPDHARAALASALASGPWMMRADALAAMKRMADPRSVYRPDPCEDDDDRPWWAGPPPYNAPGDVGGVRVIPVYGPIFRHETYLGVAMARVFGGTSIPSLTDALRSAVNDPDVKAILFVHDSPGGQASGVADLAREIRAAAAVKPVAGFAEAQCASASYYLIAATGEITAAPDAMLGSIGVVFPLVDDSKAMEMLGLADVSVISKQSPDKWADPADPEGRKLWQATADSLGARFVADVAEYRGVPVERVLSDFGGGWIKVGDDARKAGMADRVGTFDDAVSKLQGPNRGRLAIARPAAATPATPVRASLVLNSENRRYGIVLPQR